VYIDVTIQTTGELGENRRVMRSFVAHGALRNPAMLLVTTTAGDRSVLARGPFPLAKNAVMTNITGFHGRILRQRDLQWLMNRMATQAGINRLTLKMRLMTFHTVWYISVPIMMAGIARLLGMRAWKLLQLAGRPGMALSAERCQVVS